MRSSRKLAVSSSNQARLFDITHSEQRSSFSKFYAKLTAGFFLSRVVHTMKEVVEACSIKTSTTTNYWLNIQYWSKWQVHCKYSKDKEDELDERSDSCSKLSAVSLYLV